MPLLQDQLHQLIGEEQFEHLQEREGSVGIAYRELFPYNRPIVETNFETACDLKRAVCHSSTFPFFTTNWPVALDWTSKKTTSNSSPSTKLDTESEEQEEETTSAIMTEKSTLTTSRFVDFNALPRVVVDGFFTVPRARFGCPDFDKMMPNAQVDRTICVSVFPQDLVGLTAVSRDDCISPQYASAADDLQRLLRLATQASSAKELTQVYEDGWKDAERWCRAEQDKATAAKQERGQQQSKLQFTGQFDSESLN
jgi:hypothetical protein